MPGRGLMMSARDEQNRGASNVVRQPAFPIQDLGYATRKFISAASRHQS
jgi:hypothetical protein